MLDLSEGFIGRNVTLGRKMQVKLPGTTNQGQGKRAYIERQYSKLVPVLTSQVLTFQFILFSTLLTDLRHEAITQFAFYPVCLQLATRESKVGIDIKSSPLKLMHLQQTLSKLFKMPGRVLAGEGIRKQECGLSNSGS